MFTFERMERTHHERASPTPCGKQNIRELRTPLVLTCKAEEKSVSFKIKKKNGTSHVTLCDRYTLLCNTRTIVWNSETSHIRDPVFSGNVNKTKG